jgi:hypothetical protein
MASFTTDRLLQIFREQSQAQLKYSVQNLIDIYRDRWGYIIRSELRDQFLFETYKKLQLLTTQELNLLKRVVKEISLVYKEPAVRKAITEGAEGQVEDETYAEVTKSFPMDLIMQEANRYTNLTNNILMKIVMRGGKIDYDMVLFNNAEIISHLDDWKKIIGIKYYVNLELEGLFSANADRKPALMNDPSNTVSAYDMQGADYERAFLYTLEDVTVAVPELGIDETVEKGFIYVMQKIGGEEKVVEKMENPYRDETGNVVLPFVLMSKTYPVDELLDFSTGNDLRDANVNLAVNLVHLNALIKFQSWKQLWMKLQNKDDFPADMRIDPAVIIKLFGENAEIGTVDIQADIDKLWSVIQKRVTTVLSQHGISPENFTLSATPESGFALQISNMAKLEARQTQLPLYRMYEQQLFDLTRIVWNHHNPGNPIDVKAKFAIDFGEVSFPKSPQEEQTEFTFKKQHNVLTPIDLIMKENPDLTKEQAVEVFNENKRFNDANIAQVAITSPQQPGEGDT